MNILMMTNTYLPHVGGVARSIAQFSQQLRSEGHRVKIVAPEFDNMPSDEIDVIRIPAIRNFNHTDFSVIRPVPHPLTSALHGFEPDIVHSHHPFLMGNIALRVAHNIGAPLVFTHHTKYEDYTHNLVVDGDVVKRFAIQLATRYANLCDLVIAPSESIKSILLERGVTKPVRAVSTGVTPEFFGSDDQGNFREQLGIPDEALVIGHLGRISKEKNVEILASAAIQSIENTKDSNSVAMKNSCFVLFGDGPEAATVENMFRQAGLEKRFFRTGMISREEVPNAYRTMDVFLFSSTSETQGMVITEAMASAKPVVAIDAPGVRDVVIDRVNGRLVSENDASRLADALDWVLQLDSENFEHMRGQALLTAQKYTMEKSCTLLLDSYKTQIEAIPARDRDQFDLWTQILRTVDSEWQIVASAVAAASDSVVEFKD